VTRKPAPQAAAQARALALLGRWNRIARGHLALAGGCSCGTGAVSLSVADLESQLIEFLFQRFGREAAGRAWLEGAGILPDGSGRIDAVLARLARPGAPPAMAADLLEQLEISIDSFAQLHRGAP